MTETEKKALALVNELGVYHYPSLDSASMSDVRTAFCRAIEQHEAFRQEVSDACKKWTEANVNCREPHDLDRFILPKPDPLVEAWLEASPGNHIDDAREECAKISASLATRGLPFGLVGYLYGYDAGVRNDRD